MMETAEKVVAELRADLAKMAPGEREFWTARLMPMFDLIAHQAARLEEVTRERDEARAAAGDTTWFWKIVDAQGLNNVSSDEVVALRELVDGFAALTAAEAEKERLRGLLDDVLAANQRFRDQMPADWEGDPLNDACELARACLSSKKEG